MRWLLVLMAIAVTSCTSQPQEATTATSEAAPTTTATTITGNYEELECPDFGAPRSVGTVEESDLDELSGLAVGRTNPDLLWTHNDSGDSPRVFAITQSGELRLTAELSDASALDYEDIAISSNEGRNRLWVADTGDNYHLRGAVRIYSFDEPFVSVDGPATEVVVPTTELVVRFRQPGTTDEFESVNSEAFFIDRQGNGYLVAKENDSKTAWVFRIVADDMAKERATAEPLVEVTTSRTGKGVGATGADLSADGKTLVIKNYNETFLWPFDGDSPSAALIAAPTAPCVVKAGSGEAIAVLGDGSLMTVEEGSDSPLLLSRRN